MIMLLCHNNNCGGLSKLCDKGTSLWTEPSIAANWTSLYINSLQNLSPDKDMCLLCMPLNRVLRWLDVLATLPM